MNDAPLNCVRHPLRSKKFTDVVGCPYCGADVYVTYARGSPGKTCGPPERCWPPEGDAIDTPDECEVCRNTFTEKTQDNWCAELALRGDYA